MRKMKAFDTQKCEQTLIFANNKEMYYNIKELTHTPTKMLHKASHGTLAGTAIFLFVSNIAVATMFPSRSSVGLHSAAPAVTAGNVADCGSACTADTATGSSAHLLAAKQLQQRLSASGGMVPGVATLVRALEEKEELLKRSLTITVRDPNNASVPAATWTVSLPKNPELVMLRTQWSSASYVINERKLAEWIRLQKFEGLMALSSITVDTFKDDGKVTRAVDVPVARDGYAYNSAEVAHDIALALQNGHNTLELSLPFEKSTVQFSMNGVTKKMDLLSSGRSDFAGSPDERIWNVYKAIDERVNNIIVKPGEVFSFVDTLGGPVTLQKGWKEGLGLFGGGAARTPGAGICQAATTAFRAALLAGFPIVEKRNHSMWVDHYEPYGAGLDATIFPGVHDMRFKNDSTSTILIQAYIHGTEVTMNFYGTDDHREVAFDGPYFYNTKSRPAELRPLGKDQVGWVQTVTYANGKEVTKPYVATYHKGIPRFVFDKYANVPGEIIMHTLAFTGTTLADAR